MSAGTNQIFVATPKAPKCRLTAANTARDGTGSNLVTLYTAGANGAFFLGFRYNGEGTTTAGVIRIFVQTAAAGNIELLREMLTTAATPSATVAVASDEWYPASGIVLGAGDVVTVGTHNAETFSCWLMGGGDY